jgi:hypothetical protein
MGSPWHNAHPPTTLGWRRGVGREPVRDVGGGTRSATVRDLDGNVLGLLQEG